MRIVISPAARQNLKETNSEWVLEGVLFPATIIVMWARYEADLS